MDRGVDDYPPSPPQRRATVMHVLHVLVGTFRPEGTAKLLGAGLTRNGKTLATIGDDRSVTLWVVGENKPLAKFHAPSPLVARLLRRRSTLVATTDGPARRPFLGNRRALARPGQQETVRRHKARDSQRDMHREDSQRDMGQSEGHAPRVQ